MALQRSTIADKNIVDRTRANRNSDVARAVQRTRDKLSEQAGTPAYDRELLKLHARAMLNTALAIPVMVMVVLAAGVFAGLGMNIVTWALVTVACYSGLALIARQVDRAETIEPDKVRRGFLLGHLVSGAGWAYFAWIDCNACQVDEFPVLKAV